MSEPAAYTFVVFHIVAHPDDWVLFGGEQAFLDLQTEGRKVVFIHTTAGDAGQTTGWWEAREQGAIAAVRSAIVPCPLTLGITLHGGHPIVQYRCLPATLYFLRLPDGNPHGTGYPSTGETSLARLRDSGRPLRAVDGSTSYSNWQDLRETLASIVAHERQGIDEAHPWVHAADPDEATNPGDHADHRATSQAVREIASGVYNLSWWRTYCTDALPPNLEGAALANKERLFSAYSAEVERITALAGTPVAPSQGEWRLWGPKSFVRRVPHGSGGDR